MFRGALAPCPSCGSDAPVDDVIGTCGPCFYSPAAEVARRRDEGAKVPAALEARAAAARDGRQPGLAADEMCDDCAFRPDSCEVLDGTVEVLVMGGGTAGFFCHKPFLEPAQRWGLDIDHAGRFHVVLIKGPHWRACAGAARVDGGDLELVRILARSREGSR